METKAQEQHFIRFMANKKNVVTYRVIAMFIDDDTTGKTLVVCLNFKCSFPAIQTIFLDKVYIIHAYNLEKRRKKG